MSSEILIKYPFNIVITLHAEKSMHLDFGVHLLYYHKVFNHRIPFNPIDVFIVYSPDAPYLQKPIKAINRLLSVPFSDVLMPGMPCLLPYVPLRSHLKQFDISAYVNGSAI
jgi:hypothetical protein